MQTAIGIHSVLASSRTNIMDIKRSVILSLVGVYAIFYLPKTVNANAIAKEFTGAKCGSVVEQFISTEETVQLSSEHLLSNGAIPAGCEITWLVNMQIGGGHSMENFGLNITGDLELLDSQNDDSCTSSELFLSDEGEEKDESSIKQKLCGTKKISYVTYQDFVSITLRVSENGAQGKGFSFTVTPFYGCGGFLRGTVGSELALNSPAQGQSYPDNIFCMWMITVPAGMKAQLQCPLFDLPNKKKRKCKKDLVKVQAAGKNKAYCAKDLQKKTNINSAMVTVKFRSNGQATSNEGFKCKVKFIPQ